MKTILFDFNRTLYDPDTQALIPGVQSTLIELSAKDIHMCLVSRKEGDRQSILEKLDIEQFFTHIMFVDEKNLETFTNLMTQTGAAKKHTYIVGDYLHEEIRIGNQIGVKTIWFKNGKFAGLVPETKYDHPEHIITSMNELIEIIDR